MFASRLPWVSIAARGAPAVPLVNISTARWSGATSATGSGSAASSSSSGTAPSTGVAVDGDDVADRRPARPRSTSRHVAAALRSTTTPTAPTAASSRSQLGRRARRVERHDDGTEPDERRGRRSTNGWPLPQTSATRSPSADAEAGQAAAQAVDLVAQLAVGDRLVAADRARPRSPSWPSMIARDVDQLVGHRPALVRVPHARGRS